mgnify:CR=1 FL=1
MEESQVSIVLVSMPDAQKACSMAKDLVENRLAACVNVLEGVRSFYRWRGEICQEPEVLLIIKTRKESLEALIQKVRSLHPYELPEILALDVVGGLSEYMGWVREETG